MSSENSHLINAILNILDEPDENIINSSILENDHNYDPNEKKITKNESSRRIVNVKEIKQTSEKVKHPSIAKTNQNNNLGVDGFKKINRCAICTRPVDTGNICNRC